MKKTKLFAIIAGVFAFAAVVVSCGGEQKKSSETFPAEIEQTYFTYIQKGETDKALDYWMSNLADDSQVTEENKESMKEFYNLYIEKFNAGINHIKISVSEAEDGMSAKVYTKLSMKDGSVLRESHSYVKKDGVWKIDNK